MADKIVRDVDETVWRVFSGYCKIKNKKMGHELTEILKEKYNVKGDKFVT